MGKECILIDNCHQILIKKIKIKQLQKKGEEIQFIFEINHKTDEWDSKSELNLERDSEYIKML